MTKCYKKRKDVIKEEVESPKLIFHPLWPKEKDTVFKPAHIFVYKCKVCGYKKDYLQDLINDKLEFRRVPPRVCGEMHLGAMKSLQSELISDSLEVFKPSFTVVDSVAMNKVSKCSEVGMVYSYVCLSPGLIFEGLVVDLNSNRLNQLGLDSEFEAYLGRGASRGLGLVRIVIEEKPDYLSQVIEKFRGSLERTKPFVVTEALSPNLSSRWRRVLETIPHLNFKQLYIAGKTDFSGFSLITNTPKASVSCVKPGSLAFFKYDNGDYLALSKALAQIHLTGIEPFNWLGLNIVEVVG